MAIHIAWTSMVGIDAVGGVVNKNSATIAQVAASSSEIRVLPGDNAPNAAAYPTIEDYLVTEEAAGFLLQYMNNTIIVTRSP